MLGLNMHFCYNYKLFIRIFMNIIFFSLLIIWKPRTYILLVLIKNENKYK
jgi:hypothetical protein